MKLALPESQQLRDAAITATQARRWLASAPVVEAIVANASTHRLAAPLPS